MKLKLEVNNYLVVTPNEHFLCNDIPHIINSLRPYCFKMNSVQLKSFNSSINTHVKKGNYKQPLKQHGNRNKYIRGHSIWVIKLDDKDLENYSF